MTTTANDILDRASALSADERVRLVEGLLDTLRPVDPDILAAWTAEGEDRLDGYLAGDVKPIDAIRVLGRHIKQ